MTQELCDTLASKSAVHSWADYCFDDFQYSLSYSPSSNLPFKPFSVPALLPPISRWHPTPSILDPSNELTTSLPCFCYLPLLARPPSVLWGECMLHNANMIRRISSFGASDRAHLGKQRQRGVVYYWDCSGDSWVLRCGMQLGHRNQMGRDYSQFWASFFPFISFQRSASSPFIYETENDSQPTLRLYYYYFFFWLEFSFLHWTSSGPMNEIWGCVKASQ